MNKLFNATNFNYAFAMNAANVLNNVRLVRMVNANYAAKSYEDTEFHQALIVNADSIGYTFDVNDDRPERIVKSFFAGVSSYLSFRKVSKDDEAVALVISDVSGNFKFAAVVEYHSNTENPDEPGNWSYTMTFYEDDITDLEKVKKVNKLLIGDKAFETVMNRAAYDVGGFVFEHSNFMYDSCLLTIDTIIQVLDHEAIEGQVVDVEMPGYFTASVSVENGEKVFSITPDGAMKTLIKSDVDLED